MARSGTNTLFLIKVSKASITLSNSMYFVSMSINLVGDFSIKNANYCLLCKNAQVHLFY